jgi:hypothetical protein
VMHNGEVLISCSPPVLLLLLLLCDVELYSAEKILCFAQTKRLYLFYHVQMFVCVLDLGDDFVIFNVLRVLNVQKAPESYLSAEHTRTQNINLGETLALL